MAWASSLIIQVRNSLMVLALEASGLFGWIRRQVNEEAGYASAPEELVMETRKSVSAGRLTPAAAAVVDARLGSTKLPAEFLISAMGS